MPSLQKKIIAPSILSADFANLESEINKVVVAGADWIHVDVMDGRFVNNITIGIPVVASLKKVSKIPLDVHLMIEEPEKYVPQFIQAGSDWLTFHVEATSNPILLLQKIRSLGAKAGISLRPKTDISILDPLLSHLDLVLVMTVEPGFGGQSFMMDQVPKISYLKQKRSELGLSYLIEVDGGVSDKTLAYLTQADALVAGSYIFKNDYAKAIASLKS